MDLRGIIVCGLLAAIGVAPLEARTRLQGPTETISIHVSEGTTLSFDISPDGRWIAFDLLGQLWLVLATGGAARPITDAVRDVAEDLDPSFSPDGRRLVFRGERNGRTGLWLLNVNGGVPRQLTQLSNPDGYDGNAAWSPDGHTIAFTRVIPRDSSNPRAHSAIFLLNVDSGVTRELSISGLPNSNVSDPAWIEGGKQIAFVTRALQNLGGGSAWTVPAAAVKRRDWLTYRTMHSLLRLPQTAAQLLISLPTRTAECRCGFTQHRAGTGASRIMPTSQRRAFAGFQMEISCCTQPMVACGQSRLQVDHQRRFDSLRIFRSRVQNARFHPLVFLYPDN